jgi:hypothetical protein
MPIHLKLRVSHGHGIVIVEFLFVPTSTRYPNVTRQIDVAPDKGCPFIRHPLVLVEQRTIFFSVAFFSFWSQDAMSISIIALLFLNQTEKD